MMDKVRAHRGANLLSRLLLLAAALLLLHTCRVCRPFSSVVRWELLDETASGAKSAFSALCESLRQGETVVDAFADSYRVLTGAAAN